MCGSVPLKYGSAISDSISEGKSPVPSRMDDTAFKSLRDMARVVIGSFNGQYSLIALMSYKTKQRVPALSRFFAKASASCRSGQSKGHLISMAKHQLGLSPMPQHECDAKPECLLCLSLEAKTASPDSPANPPPPKSIPESITRLTAWEGFPKRLSIPKLKCQ